MASRLVLFKTLRHKMVLYAYTGLTTRHVILILMYLRSTFTQGFSYFDLHYKINSLTFRVSLLHVRHFPNFDIYLDHDIPKFDKKRTVGATSQRGIHVLAYWLQEDNCSPIS